MTFMLDQADPRLLAAVLLSNSVLYFCFALRISVSSSLVAKSRSDATLFFEGTFLFLSTGLH